MITKLELIEYLKHTPENTNYNILYSSLYNGSNKEAVDEFIEALSRGNLSLAALQPYLAKLYEDDKTISPEPLPPFSGGGSVPKPLTYDYMPEGYPTKSVQTTTLMEEQELAFASEEGAYLAHLTEAFEINKGQTYTVNWDGTEYECVWAAPSPNPIFGNLSIAGMGADTGEPFVYIQVNATVVFATLDTSASHTISVKTTEEIVTPMAEKFLPETLATKPDVEVVQTAANAAQTAAENAQSTANAAQTAAENAQSTAENAVKYTTSQNLTDAQKKQARTNIGAGTSSFSGNYNDLANKPISLSAPTQSDTDTTQIDVLNSTIISDKVIVYSTQHIFDTSSSIFTNLEKTMIYGYFDGGYTIIYDPAVTRWRPIDSAYVKVNDAVYYGVGIGNNSVGSDARYFFISNNGFIIISDPDVVNSECSIKYFKIKYGGANLTMPIAYLSERFIPPAIQRVGDDLILSSSTADSTKKFKITVDDSGAISATEVI